MSIQTPAAVLSRCLPFGRRLFRKLYSALLSVASSLVASIVADLQDENVWFLQVFCCEFLGKFLGSQNARQPANVSVPESPVWCRC